MHTTVMYGNTIVRSGHPLSLTDGTTGNQSLRIISIGFSPSLPEYSETGCDIRLFLEYVYKILTLINVGNNQVR